MANQVLQATGYGKFCSKLSPLSKPNALLSPHVDVSTLHSIFSTSKTHRNILLYDFDGKVISRRQRATEEKATAFNSIFDLNKIRRIVGEYGLEFNCSIVILLGMVTARLIGTKVPPDEVSNLSISTDTESSEKVDAKILRRTIDHLEEELKKVYIARQQLFITRSKSHLKQGWITIDGEELSDEQLRVNQNIYDNIKQMKDMKAKYCRQINKNRAQIQEYKQELFLRNQKSQDATDSTKFNLDYNTRAYHGKAEDTQLDWEVAKRKKK